MINMNGFIAAFLRRTYDTWLSGNFFSVYLQVSNADPDPGLWLFTDPESQYRYLLLINLKIILTAIFSGCWTLSYLQNNYFKVKYKSIKIKALIVGTKINQSLTTGSRTRIRIRNTEHGSGSLRLLNTDPMRIRIRNTGFYRINLNMKMVLIKIHKNIL